MALNFGASNVFGSAREFDIGLWGENKAVSSSSVKSFIVGGASDQYDCTTSFAEVDGMTVEHESRTGRVLVIYSSTASPGVSEIINVKLQKDGVDVTGTEQTAFVSSNPGTSYLGIAPGDFISRNTDTDEIQQGGEMTKPNADGISFIGAVNLPHGATITGAIVYGADTGQTWNLSRTSLSSTGQDILATANAGTEDTSISNGTVDNTTYGYFFELASWDTDDDIYGARITYTPSQFSFQAEGPNIPLSINYVEVDAGRNTWRVMAKTSQVTPDDSFINDRILIIVDI